MTTKLQQMHDHSRRKMNGAMRLSVSDHVMRLCIPSDWEANKAVIYANTVNDPTRLGKAWKIREAYEPAIASALREVPCPISKKYKHIMLVTSDLIFDELFQFASLSSIDVLRYAIGKLFDYKTTPK